MECCQQNHLNCLWQVERLVVTPHLTSPFIVEISPANGANQGSCLDVVLSDNSWSLSPGRKMKLMLSRLVSPSIFTDRFSTVKRSLNFAFSFEADKWVFTTRRNNFSLQSCQAFFYEVACLGLATSRETSNEF